MPKIMDEPLTALQIRLFQSDLEKLRKLFGKTIGVNQAVRTIVRSFIKQTEAKADTMINEIEREASQHSSSLLGEEIEIGETGEE